MKFAAFHYYLYISESEIIRATDNVRSACTPDKWIKRSEMCLR